MKKYSIFLIALFILVAPINNAEATVFEVDQSYKPSPAFGTYDINSNLPIAQTFKPEKAVLSGAETVINTTSSGAYNFTLILKKSGVSLSSSTITENLIPGNQTLYFSFNDFPSLIVDNEYALYLQSTDNNAKWSYGQSGAVGGYTRGHGIIAGTDNTADFHFVTYGPVEDLQDEEDIQKIDPEEDASTTLAAPTNLEVLNKGSDYIEISWDRVDDENLGGYKLYWGDRRKELDEEVDVGDDSTYKIEGLKPEKFYYFAVTVYDEDRKESARSKTLKVETKTDKKKTDSSDILWYIARILSVLILIGAVVGWYYWKKNKSRQAKKEGKVVNVNIDKKQRRDNYPNTKFKFED
ncbi:fibronectin type III domain-containing protein [Patescibacteria group bacterium]